VGNGGGGLSTHQVSNVVILSAAGAFEAASDSEACFKVLL